MPPVSDDIKMIQDARPIRGELERRGLWRHFRISPILKQTGDQLLIDSITDPLRTDLFFKFRGHEKPEDNGWLWLSVSKTPSEPDLIDAVLEKAIASIGPLKEIEAIIPSDRMIKKGDH